MWLNSASPLATVAQRFESRRNEVQRDVGTADKSATKDSWQIMVTRESTPSEARGCARGEVSCNVSIKGNVYDARNTAMRAIGGGKIMGSNVE